MKKINLFLSNLFICSVLFAQKADDNIVSKNELRYGFSMNQSLTWYGLPTAVLFTANYKQHQFDLGPQFALGRTFNKSQKDIGLEFNYRYYPHGDSTWFNPYLLFNASYFYEYSERLGTYTSNDPGLNTQPTIYTKKTHNLVLNVGYGVKFRLVGGFYLGSHVGFGMYRLSESFERNMFEVDSKSIEKNNRFRPGALASVFLGYKF